MMQTLISYLQFLSITLPLEIFCFIGSFIEEIIGPIPSPVVLVTAGSLVFHRHQSLIYLFLLAIIASAGKTLASWLVFIISDKIEDLIFIRYGKILGVLHQEVEKIGNRFNRTWQDDFLIILFRAIPVFPTTAVSVAAGFIKLDRNTFVRATFIGFFIRSLFLLYIGYAGIETFGIVKSWLAE